MPRKWLYLASTLDAVRILTGHEATRQLPPPGFELHYSNAAAWEIDPEELQGEESFRLPLYVQWSAGDTEPIDWWWETLGDLVLHVPEDVSEAAQRLISLLNQTVGRFAGAVGNWPVILKGKDGSEMRWLQSTFRGTLFGEQFQHKIDWGNPGADPDFTQAEAASFAAALGGAWSADFFAGVSGSWAPDVVYTEVGVTQLNQADPNGDVTDSYATQWFTWDAIDRPTGEATTNSLPYEVACCVTLQSNYRGASGRGRFYLPPFAYVAMAPNGIYNLGVVGGVGTAVGTFFDSVMLDTDVEPIVVSRRRRVLNSVQTVEVGKVPDSQRRRRRSLDEARLVYWTRP